jgi:predicted 3-demethylubiquinone-9 3-methyltransferase (glyoxalase superfamily)
MSKIVPCLWFDTEAEEAANFYVATFAAMGQPASIGQIELYPEGARGPAGTVMTVAFSLAGQEFIGLNGGPAFPFTEAISMTIRCADQDEIDGYWGRLTTGGKEVQCGWLKDRFGLSWQVVPTELQEMLRSAEPDQVDRLMQAVLGMVKLDIAALRRAYEGA